LYDDFSSSPLVVDGVVYVGGVDGSACFYAINAQTGEEKWSFTPMMGDFVYSSPALLDDTVYFGGSEGLYALDIQTGEEKWLFETESTVQSPAIGDDGTIYFGSKDPALYAVDAQTGELKWKNDELVDPAGWTWNMSPATTIADGLVYAAIADTTSGGVLRFFFAVRADPGNWYGGSSPKDLTGLLCLPQTGSSILAAAVPRTSWPWMPRRVRNCGASKQKVRCTPPLSSTMAWSMWAAWMGIFMR
jgi:outer membrane protein assembly factor BamB